MLPFMLKHILLLKPVPESKSLFLESFDWSKHFIHHSGLSIGELFFCHVIEGFIEHAKECLYC